MEKETKEISKTERTSTRRIFVPRADIVETQDAILLFADMPGVSEKTVEITLENGVLSLKGVSQFTPPEGQNLSYAEFRDGDYERVFTLSEQIDRDKIEASVRNGLLRLRLPKTQAHVPKKIAVRSN